MQGWPLWLCIGLPMSARRRPSEADAERRLDAWRLEVPLVALGSAARHGHDRDRGRARRDDTDRGPEPPLRRERVVGVSHRHVDLTTLTGRDLEIDALVHEAVLRQLEHVRS